MKPLSPLSLQKGYVSVKKSADQNLAVLLIPSYSRGRSNVPPKILFMN